MNVLSWLIDTSALLRLVSEDDVHHEVTAAAVSKLLASGASIWFTPQVVRESWSVLTRPREVNGYGLVPGRAEAALDLVSRVLRFAADTPEIYPQWVSIVTTHQVSGRKVHDAYHVAAMLAHGISHVLTLDDRDFKRYSEIVAIHPEAV